MRPAWLQSPHSKSEIGPVKWHGIPLHSDVTSRLEMPSGGRDQQKESAAHVWLI